MHSSPEWCFTDHPIGINTAFTKNDVVPGAAGGVPCIEQLDYAHEMK